MPFPSNGNMIMTVKTQLQFTCVRTDPTFVTFTYFSKSLPAVIHSYKQLDENKLDRRRE